MIMYLIIQHKSISIIKYENYVWKNTRKTEMNNYVINIEHNSNNLLNIMIVHKK